MKKILTIIAVSIGLCSTYQVFSQTASRITITSITPSAVTGQDYSPWLNDDTTNLIPDVFSAANNRYIDIKLKLQSKTSLTKLSLFHYEGDFSGDPASIYAVNGTVKTLIGTFTGAYYLTWLDINLATPVLADTIVIHKYENNIPQKIKIYGYAPALATSTTGTLTVCAGATTTLGNATTGGTWSTSNATIATVNGTGVVTGMAGGTATIFYTAASQIAAATVTVSPLPNAGSIGGTTSVCAASTTTLSAAGGASGGTWSSSATTIATVSATGVVKGVAAGTATISYKVSNGCGNATATKMVTVSVMPSAGSITGAASVCTGATIALSSSGTAGGTWSSSATAKATVSATGVVTGVAAGSATITYKVTNVCGTVTATKPITVNALPSAGSVTGTASICAPGTTTLSASGPSGGTWVSSATAVATVGATGIVTGVSAGTAAISYQSSNGCGTVAASKTVSVNMSPSAGSITGASTVCVGGTATFSSSGTAGGTWSSSATGKATVSATGVVTGVSAGTATISYKVTNSCATAIATKAITVNALPAAGTITGATSICIPGTTTLSISGASGGSWISSTPGVATVSGAGTVTAVTAGATTISYQTTSGCGTVAATKTLTVSTAASAGSVTGTTEFCAGANSTLSASGTAGGTWNSASPAVATVSATGVVTGLTGGTTAISYSVTNGCGTVSASKTITIDPLPATGTITGTTIILNGTTTTMSDAVTGGTWSSTNTAVATITSSGTVYGVSIGTSTISYTVSNGCGTAAATRALTVVPTSTVTVTDTGAVSHGKIPIDGKRWYQLNNVSNGLEGLFDSVLDVSVQTGWGKILNNYDAYYPVLPGEQINIDSIKFYDGEGTNESDPFTLLYIDSLWNRIPIATFIGTQYNDWVGPDPSNPFNYTLSVPANNVRYLVINCTGTYPNEMQLFGSYIAPNALPAAPAKSIKLKQEFGANGFEWNYEDPVDPSVIDETRLAAAKSFTAVRHYLDWSKLEPNEGGYTFNPSHEGSWNYDTMYARCKTEGIEVLADIKTLPDWMVSTYPADQQDAENVPVNYGADFTDPASYLKQAKLGFQFAARYGSNAGVSSALLSVDASTRWTGDPANTVKKGLGLIKYIECDNERDKWWKGRQAYQTGREYAANLSAFYDGNMNTMGAGVGVKNADSTMKIVMAGTAGPVTDYFKGMIDWCKQYRGYKADGSVNLCWDVINYHIYADNEGLVADADTRGVAPEVALTDTTAKNFVNAAHVFAGDMPVWITETGYDINQSSVLKAIPIGSKTALQTEADWILRTSLLNARCGIERTFFFEMYDDDTSNPTKFSSSGLINENKTRKPAADYLYQANKLMGEYVYMETISTNPLVDRYELAGQSAYVLVKPSENGSSMSYSLSLPGATGSAHVYKPAVGQDSMNVSTVAIASGNVSLTVTETPIFVLPPGSPAGRTAAANNVPMNNVFARSVTVYPNPASGHVSICVDNEDRNDVSVSIFTASGRTCNSYTFKKDVDKITETIDISSLPGGLYFMDIIQGNERTVKKIIKTN